MEHTLIDIDDIQKFIFDNKICFATNSRCLPGTTFFASLKTYINFIPTHNFMIIPGYNTATHKPYYSEEAFSYMLVYLKENTNFDYVIYIDDDCFIKSMTFLLEEFIRFKDSNSCMAGIQDGTVICHRNHSQILVNTFLSFWKLKDLNIETFLKYRNNILTNFNGAELDFFKQQLQTNNINLYNIIKQRAHESTLGIKQYRDKNYKVDVPYVSIVKNDPSNPVEPHQIPYSTDDDSRKENSEPYYATEEALILATQLPIYYLFSTDFYDPYKNTLMDNSGLTSVVLANDEDKLPIAFHTWFSRLYSKWPKFEKQRDNTIRINSVIRNLY